MPDDNTLPPPAHGTAPEPTKVCWSCGCPISLPARICPECKAPQDWRGRIDRLSPIMALLSLITALASVLSLAAPVLQDMSRAKGADLRMVFVDASTGSLQLIVENEGRTAAVIRDASLITDASHDHRGETQEDATTLQWHLLPESSPPSQKYVRPGETTLLVLRTNAGFTNFPKLIAVPDLDRALSQKEWVLQLMVEAVQTDGEKAPIRTLDFVGFNTWAR